MKLIEFTDQVYTKSSHVLFWNFVKLKSNLSKKQKAKILTTNFESTAWRKNIDHGFRFSKHDLYLENFDPESIRKYDCVVPIGLDDLVYADKMRHLIPDNPFPIPDRKSVQLCDNKYLFNLEVCKNGFEEYIPKMDIKGNYPYILKKNIDAGGQNSHVINNAEKEKEFHHLLEDPEYYTQEFIPGSSEYTTHILIKNQEIVKSLTFKYKFNTGCPVKGKTKQAYSRICKSSYLQLFQSILNSINFEGLCNVNYKIHNKRPMIIEVNPRCGFSLSPFLFYFIEDII